jgi:hypothetical protein
MDGKADAPATNHPEEPGGWAGIRDQVEGRSLSSALATPAFGDNTFDELDFDLIYHDGALPPGAIGEVNNIRMSEVVVHETLDLSLVSNIVCRTPYEARTLEHLLRELNVVPPKIISSSVALFSCGWASFWMRFMR